MLSEQEADRLLHDVDKWFQEGEVLDFSPDTQQTCELKSEERGEIFHFDSERTKLSIGRVTYHTRVRKIVTLVRVDLGETARHRNPDDELIEGPHIHIYSEGAGDAWAYPIEKYGFYENATPSQIFAEFCDFCAIVNRPTLQLGFY